MYEICTENTVFHHGTAQFMKQALEIRQNQKERGTVDDKNTKCLLSALTDNSHG